MGAVEIPAELRKIPDKEQFYRLYHEKKSHPKYSAHFCAHSTLTN